MFRYNPKANYQPNGGRYLQILSGKDLYKQTIVVSAGTHDDTFRARFPNIFVDYPLGQMRIGDNASINLTGYPPRADCRATNFFRQNPRPGDSFSVQNSGPRVGKNETKSPPPGITCPVQMPRYQ